MGYFVIICSHMQYLLLQKVICVCMSSHIYEINDYFEHIYLVPSHVGIRGNELADAAAKAALNERLTIMTLSYSDFKPLVKRFIRGQWSDFWATQINNKLHSVQPTLVDHCQIEIVAENSLFSADYD